MSARPGKTVSVKSLLGWVSGTVAVLSLVLGVVALNASVRDWRETRAGVEQLVAGADAALASGDFRRAKAGYDEAMALDATSPVLREGRLNLSLTWLRSMLDDIREGETFSELTAQLLPSLYEGLRDKSDREQSIIWAHIGWAQHVAAIGRETLDLDTRRAADIRRVYNRAAALDPDNFYVPLFRGYLRLDASRGMESAEDEFAAAMEQVTRRYGAGSDEYRWAREMTLLGSLYFTSPHDEPGLTLLRSLNAMRLAGDALPPDRVLDRMFDTYRSHAATAHGFETMMKILPPAEHRETFEWLLGSETADRWLSSEHNRLYLLSIRAALQEDSDPELALALYREIYAIEWAREETRARIEEGIARLSGEQPQSMVERLGRNYASDPIPGDGDIRAFHLATLENFDIQYESPNSQAAFDYLLHLDADDPERRLAEVTAARERILGLYRQMKAAIAEQGYTSGNSASGEIIATRNMLQAHRIVAVHRLRNDLLDEALAELDDAFAICDAWVPGWIYQLRALALSRRNSPGDPDRAADNLARYIDAEVRYGGALDWSDVKTDAGFAALRGTARYAALMRGR